MDALDLIDDMIAVTPQQAPVAPKPKMTPSQQRITRLDAKLAAAKSAVDGDISAALSVIAGGQ